MEKLTWGSIAPDILPKYRLYRHYYDNSIDYIILRIAKVIFINRFLDFNKEDAPSLKIFSRDLGIISHYLADFTCRAHADRWELPKTLVKHVRYELDLNEYSKSHEFSKIPYDYKNMTKDANTIFQELPKIKLFIEQVVYDYLNDEKSFAKDLDYALSLNKLVFEFIVESILEYKELPEYSYSM